MIIALIKQRDELLEALVGQTKLAEQLLRIPVGPQLLVLLGELRRFNSMSALVGNDADECGPTIFQRQLVEQVIEPVRIYAQRSVVDADVVEPWVLNDAERAHAGCVGDDRGGE